MNCLIAECKKKGNDVLSGSVTVRDEEEILEVATPTKHGIRMKTRMNSKR